MITAWFGLIAVSMPLGVEHLETDVVAACKVELIAVSMPLGVEHKAMLEIGRTPEELIAVSMPLGVEHFENLLAASMDRETDRRLDASGR